MPPTHSGAPYANTGPQHVNPGAHHAQYVNPGEQYAQFANLGAQFFNPGVMFTNLVLNMLLGIQYTNQNLYSNLNKPSTDYQLLEE